MKKIIFLLVIALALGLFVGIRMVPSARAEVTPGSMIQLPILGYLGNQNQNVEVTVEIQNVGRDYTRAIMLLWGAPSGYCEPQQNIARKAEFTGILPPGSAWVFTSALLPAWAQSAIVFSIPADASCIDFNDS